MKAVWWKRLLAIVTDILLLIFILAALVEPFLARDIAGTMFGNGGADVLFGSTTIWDYITHNYIQVNETRKEPFDLVLTKTIGSLIIVFGLILQEAFYNITIGKFIFGLRVVNGNFQKPSLSSIVIRNTVRLVPFNCLLNIGYRPIGLHNRLANTLVIETENLFIKFFGNIMNKYFNSKKGNISNSKIQKLNELNNLRRNGGINDEEYNLLKEKILSQ